MPAVFSVCLVRLVATNIVCSFHFFRARARARARVSWCDVVCRGSVSLQIVSKLQEEEVKSIDLRKSRRQVRVHVP